MEVTRAWGNWEWGVSVNGDRVSASDDEKALVTNDSKWVNIFFFKPLKCAQEIDIELLLELAIQELQ